jgi:hypothetical protein
MPKHRRRVPRYLRRVQEQAVRAGKWDSRFCSKETYDRVMTRMPKDAIAADMTKHVEVCSYSARFWYEDVEFACRDCGSIEVWTAAAQRWWYEVAKGLIYTRAVRCRGCRKDVRARHGGTPRRSLEERTAASEKNAPTTQLDDGRGMETKS